MYTISCQLFSLSIYMFFKLLPIFILTENFLIGYSLGICTHFFGLAETFRNLLRFNLLDVQKIQNRFCLSAALNIVGTNFKHFKSSVKIFLLIIIKIQALHFAALITTRGSLMSASGKQPALDWETMHAFSVTFFIFLYRIAGFKLHRNQATLQ